MKVIDIKANAAGFPVNIPSGYPQTIQMEYDKWRSQYNNDKRYCVNGIAYEIKDVVEKVEMPKVEAVDAPTQEVLVCECGKEAANATGLKIHQKACKTINPSEEVSEPSTTEEAQS